MALVGFWGVNIEDGGLIPGLTRRILFGEAPHADFISPLPTGAAVLHLVDYALPLPLVLSSKVVTIAEFVAYGVLFSLFIYGKRLGELSLPESAGVVIAVLVGLHQFPVISFYTIDGLVLTGGAFVLVQRGLDPLRLSRIGGAFFLLGVATTTKQSFWFAPFFFFAWCALTLARKRKPVHRLIRFAAIAVGACALAPLAYVIWVSLGGGFHEMRAELTGTTRVYGDNLLTQFRDPHLRSELVPSLLAALALLGVVRLAPNRLPRALDGAIRISVTIVFLRLTLDEHLSFNGNWSQRLFWCVVGVAVIRSIAERRVNVVGLAVAFTGWMVTLSYGAPNPALAGGASAIYLADSVWRGAPRYLGSRTPLAFAAGAAAAAALVAGVSIHVRTHDDYGVLRKAEIWTLGGNAAGVKMDQATATYLSDAAKCVRKYPAKWQAVLPEGALADALYSLRNPFPIDWFWPPSYDAGGGRQRLIDATSKIDARGNYLLLFQTNAIPGPNIPGKIMSFIHDPELGTEITSRLVRARRSQCGEFIAFYNPAH
jgi:hypothetical protein